GGPSSWTTRRAGPRRRRGRRRRPGARRRRRAQAAGAPRGRRRAAARRAGTARRLRARRSGTSCGASFGGADRVVGRTGPPVAGRVGVARGRLGGRDRPRVAGTQGVVDGDRRERREQDPVAVVPRGDVETVGGPADQGRVVRRSGAGPRRGLGEHRVVQAGEQDARVAQQRVHVARAGQVVVGALVGG